MTTYAELTGFKRDILWTLADLDTPHGLAIKERLEDDGWGQIHHGRLYPNLDDLADAGLVEKGTIDKRTNSYDLTYDARQMLQQRLAWEQKCRDQMEDDQ
jgi:PadR family transcriptional regulator PadR